MRRASRTDANHAQIKNAFLRLGFSVHDTHTVGGGFPDLAVAKHRQTLLIEIKTDKGKLGPSQYSFRSTWRGDIYTVRTVNDVVDLYNTMRAML